MIMLYGVVGAIESGCYYFRRLLGQYRYCEEEYVGEEQAINYILLIGTIFMLSLGAALYLKSAKLIHYYENKEKSEEQT